MPHYYQTFDPKAELNGTSAMMFSNSIMHDDLEDILKRRGLDSIDPNGWYPLQSLLDVFNDIAEGRNASSTFVSIGMATAELSINQMLSADLKSLSLAEFWQSYPDVWLARHRKGDVGYVTCVVEDERNITLTFRAPYPDDMIYGLVYGYTRYFRPKGSHFSVAYDQDMPTREAGGYETILHIHIG